MDVNNLRTGEKIAGASGIALLLLMFVLNWFNIEGAGDLGGLNAWQSFGIIDLVLLLAALAGIGLAFVSAGQTSVNLPVSLSALAAGLGILSVALLIFRIISPPDLEGFGVEVELERAIGVFLGLIAAAGVAYGGWTAMQEEGTSFSDQADRLQGPGTDAGTGGTPPPPPPAGPAA